MIEEIWRPVPGWSGQYEASTMGRVRSLDREIIRKDGRVAKVKGRVLKPGLASHGYPTVCFGRGKTMSVHVIIAITFIGPVPDGYDVRHKDDNPLNPELSNLEFGTRRENILDSVSHNRWKGPQRTAKAREYKTPDSYAKTWATRRDRYGPSGRP